MDTRSAAVVAEWNRLRASLVAEFPELVEDDETLADTLDGETDAIDVVAGLIRASRRRYAYADGLTPLQRDMIERKKRHEAAGDRLEAAALEMLAAIGVRKVERPDFTASVRVLAPKVEIIDQAALPDRAWRIIEKREPDKTEIKRLLDAGETVPGACLSNGGETLTVRTK